MRLWSGATAFAFAAASIWGYAHAHSQERNPLTYLSLVEHPLISTPSHRVHSASHFDLTFNLHRKLQRIKLTLEPNEDILPEDAVVKYLDEDGNVKREEKIVRGDFRVFKGLAWTEDEHKGHWTNVGSSRIVVRRDGEHPLFEGTFSIYRDHHHIQLSSNYMRTKHEEDPALEETSEDFMVVFRDSDISYDTASAHTELKRSAYAEPGCQAHELEFNSQPSHPVFSKVLKMEQGVWGSMSVSSLFGKRQIDTSGVPAGGNSAGVNLKSTIGQKTGCPDTRKVALVGVATDCTYTASFNSTDAVRQNVITQMNSASSLYEKTFNITLGLRNLTVSDQNCPGAQQAATPWNSACTSNITIQSRLNQFSQWRGQRQDGNAYWMLLTTCNSGPAVGLAWLGQACVSTVVNSQSSQGGGQEYVSGANVVARTSTEWQVIAHETGHIFGAVHDCDSQTCADGNTVAAQQCCPLSTSSCDANARFIMNPSTGPNINEFSQCSIGNICSAMQRNSVKSDCLTANKGVVTIAGNQCGNGIVEAGEDCDCGGTASCGSNNCCDPTTCKFKSNAVCDDSNEDCCKGCQFAPSTTVCRASTGQCDPEEKCSGTTATCPSDVTAPNGQSCGNSSGLTCASGQCTSRDQQCKTVMGSYSQNNDTYACDSMNCQLSCASPEFGAGTCYGLQQNFLDGTSCGSGGQCSNGQCRGSNSLKEIGSWISRHKALVIGIGSALAAILAILVGCCILSCIRKRKAPKQRKHVPRNYTPMGQPPSNMGQNQQYWPQPPTSAYTRPSVRYA